MIMSREQRMITPRQLRASVIPVCAGLIVLHFACLSGCALGDYASRTPWAIAENREQLQYLELGMSRPDVVQVMGKPHKREVFPDKERNVVEVLFYETEYTHSGNIPESAFTPIVLRSGRVVGWGRSLYSRVKADLPPAGEEMPVAADESESPARLSRAAANHRVLGAGCDIATLPTVSSPASLAIMDFDAAEFGDGVGRALADLARANVLASGQYILLDRENMVNILGEEDFAAAIRCDRSKCLVNFGRKLRAQKLAHGRINSVGGSIVFTLTMTDVSSGRVDAFRSVRIEGGIDAVLDAVEPITCEVVRDSLAN